MLRRSILTMEGPHRKMLRQRRSILSLVCFKFLVFWFIQNGIPVQQLMLAGSLAKTNTAPEAENLRLPSDFPPRGLGKINGAGFARSIERQNMPECLFITRWVRRKILGDSTTFLGRQHPPEIISRQKVDGFSAQILAIEKQSVFQTLSLGSSGVSIRAKDSHSLEGEKSSV